MEKLKASDDTRITYDEATGAVRSFFGVRPGRAAGCQPVESRPQRGRHDAARFSMPTRTRSSSKP